jgi:nitrogen fixation NifU-like protein
MSLQALYQELILRHYRNPRNRGVLAEAGAVIALNNPLCGDEVTLQLRIEGEAIVGVRFTGHGCSISQASASMMTEQLEGKTLAEARALAARFRQLIHGDPEAAQDKGLGDLRALAGVAKFPMRVKCAMLAWNALDEAEKVLTSPEPPK